MNGKRASQFRRLLSLLRAWPDDPARFRRAAEAVNDWPGLVQWAGLHGVIGTLGPRLLEPDGLPAEHRAELARRLALQRLKSIPSYQAMEEILRALAGADITAVALKGPILSERLFGDSSTRPSSDLDFLIADQDVPAAVAALTPLGYEAEIGPQADFFRGQHHHVHLHGQSASRPLVELHFRLSSNFGVDLAAEPYLARSLPYRTRNGVSCRILHPEDEFFYLAIHAAGHHFARLGWLYDLKLLLAKHPEIDVNRVAEQAAAARLLSPYLLALDLLRRWLGVPIRLEPRYQRAARLRRWLGGGLMEWCEAFPAGSLPARCASLCYQTVLCDGLADSLRLLRRRWAFQWA